MKTPVLLFAAALMVATAHVPTLVVANQVERACNQSGRQAANPRLCGCIGAAARMTLNNSEQRLAARFFRDPQRAQDVRQSSRSRDSQFWARYRAFGETAEAMCS